MAVKKQSAVNLSITPSTISTTVGPSPLGSAVSLDLTGIGTSGVRTLSSGASCIPLTIVGYSGQSANLAEYRNSSDTPLLKVTSAGYLGFLESSGDTYYTYLHAGDQSADITYTFPTAAPSTNGQVLSGTTGGVLSWATSTTYVGGVSTWTEITGTSQSMAVNNGYIANHAVTRITFYLPVTAAVGTVLRLVGKGAAGWRISQNAGQTIYVGSSSVATTTGVTGYIQSSDDMANIEIVCITADTNWNVASSVGNLTIN